MFLLIGISIVPATGDTALEKHELLKDRSYLGRVLHVPDDYPTIQSGIDNASNGDTVLVAPGTYTGDDNRDLDFRGKAITVTSEYGPEVTIIDCEANSSNQHRGFYFHNGENHSSIVDGFTVTGGYYDYGGGIYCYNYSSPTITKNVITGNNVYADGQDSYGAGISCKKYSSPMICNNIITNNTASASGWGRMGQGAGISCYIYCNPWIANNTIECNTAIGKGGGVYCLEHSNPTIINNYIADNTHGGISCWVYSSPNIINNTICDNFAGWGGGGIWCEQHCCPNITGNTIHGNTGEIYGGGIGTWGSSIAKITNNTIFGNSAEMGGGIQCNYYSHSIITNNLIRNNRATWEGGGISCSWDSSPLISNNTIISNSAGEYGGGIDCYPGCAPLIIDNTIVGNSADWSGGGISGYYECSPIITNNLIIDNSARFGGGINFDTYYKTMNNRTNNKGRLFCCSTSCSNSTTYEHNIIFNPASGTNSTLVIANNTIAGNSASNSGGGVYCRDSDLTIINTILWGDISLNGPEIYHHSGNLVVNYSDVQGGWTGEGNIDADPLFVLPDKKDYRLLWGSPCIDSGKPDMIDPDNTRSDIGAFFFNQNDYITLYLSPHDNSVAPGYKLGITYTLINRYNESKSFYIISEAILPDGQILNILGPVAKRLPRNYTVQKEIPLSIPRVAPFELNVLYKSRIGLPPNRLYDEDSFHFTIDYPPYEPSHPSPGNGSVEVDVDADLSWISGDPDPFDIVKYDVYLGTSLPPGQVARNHTTTSFDPGTMNYNTTYWWRVVAWDDHGACTMGPLWWFKTGTSPSVVWVDDDFNESTPGWGVTCFDNIQNGIGAVAYHGRVYVFNGTYYEHVVIDKNIDLVGEDRNITIVDGGGSGDVVRLDADGVNISGFTIRNSGNDPYGNGGIYVRSNNNTISGNYIVNNNYGGIWIKYPDGNNISGNIIINNQWGIRLEYSSNYNIISGNNITNNNKDGVYLKSSSNYNIISGNIIADNSDNGIQIYSSSNYNIISGNNIINNQRDGIYVGAWSNSNLIYENIIANNSGNGIYHSSSCNNNVIYHNNFINNTQNAYDAGTNIWNLSYPYGGNYWSDYIGVDNFSGRGQNLSGPDGIGDTPYNISGRTPPNQDRYPFMNPNGGLLEKIKA